MAMKPPRIMNRKLTNMNWMPMILWSWEKMYFVQKLVGPCAWPALLGEWLIEANLPIAESRAPASSGAVGGGGLLGGDGALLRLFQPGLVLLSRLHNQCAVHRVVAEAA